MSKLPELYFENANKWREWLDENHKSASGIYLIFYKVDHPHPSMRWEEAVRVALCYGWIDSTVKSLGNGKRRQYFCPRNAGSVWSKVNKDHIAEMVTEGRMHASGLEKIEAAKRDGSWFALDDVENGVIPEDLKNAFNKNSEAYHNYLGFSRSYQKSYLYWLHQAKRDETRQKRIVNIINLCKDNKKSRNG